MHRGGDVPAAGAPAEDASFAFDFLPFTPADQLVCCYHAPPVVGFCPLHHRHRERLFYRSSVTSYSSRGCDCPVAALRGSLASSPSQMARAKTHNRLMHYRLRRPPGGSCGNE